MSTPLVLSGVAIWDGRAARSGPPGHAVRIDGDVIVDLGEGVDRRDARDIPLEGCTAMPGLIDAHVHLTLDPAVSTPREQLALSASAVASAAAERAAGMLRAGITTARDLGGGAWLELALRDRIARGELPGPRLLCAGQPLTSPGGHCHFWGGEARGALGIDAVIRRQLERGVDWLKVMVTGGVMTRASRVASTQFSDAELQHAVKRANHSGRAVAAHCHGTAGIAQAARCGVRSVEHCSFAGPGGFGAALEADALAALAARATGEPIWVSPTVNRGWGRHLREDGELSEFGARMRRVYAALRERGVPLIASTDAGIPGVVHHHLPEALAVFAALAELAPIEALRSATSESAQALGLGDRTGTLAPGRCADVLVVEGDPTQDLAALNRPRLVVARGRVWEPSEAAA